MSKIQEAFNGTGRPLREAERQSMDEFIAQYRGTLTTPPGMVGAKTASKPVEKLATQRVVIQGQVYEVVAAGRRANFKAKVAAAKSASKAEKSTKPKALRRSATTF